MSRSCVALLSVVIMLLAAAPVDALQIGVRGGYAKADGDLFDGSGPVGSGGLYGVAAVIPLLPRIDLELAYERYTSEFEPDRLLQEQPFVNGAEFIDQSYLITAKLRLIDPAASPLGIYGGGGASLHAIEVEFEGGDLEIPDFDPDDEEFAWHAVAGIDVELPSLPFVLYAEYRFQDIQGDTKPRFNSVYAGVNLVLE